MSTMPSDPQAVLARHTEHRWRYNGKWQPSDCGECHFNWPCDAVLMARALAESEKRAELGDAWAAAEAALLEGFSFYGVAALKVACTVAILLLVYRARRNRALAAGLGILIGAVGVAGNLSALLR